MITVQAPCLTGHVTARAGWAGKDLWVVVAGGDGPHIGSVSLAIPRKGLSGDGSDSAAVSTLNVTGHKDNLVGDSIAARLAATFRCTVSVTCGIHFDGVGADKLAEVAKCVEMLLVGIERSLDGARRDRVPPKVSTRLAAHPETKT